MIKILATLIFSFFLNAEDDLKRSSSPYELASKIHAAYEQKDSAELKLMNDQARSLLIDALYKDESSYEYTRSMLIEKLVIVAPYRYRYYISLLDEDLLNLYLKKVLKVLTYLPSGSLGQKYHSLITEKIESGDLVLMPLKGLALSHESRGLFHARSNKVSLQLLSAHEIIFPLIHEFAHVKDHELIDKRTNIKNVRNSFPLYYNQQLIEEKFKNEFGRYWFLEESYAPHYSEIIPRVDTCKVYIELITNNLLKNAEFKDQKRYETVLSGQETCVELTQRELSSWKSPRPAWDKELFPWQWQLVDEYRSKWLKQNHLPDPFYQ